MTTARLNVDVLAIVSEFLTDVSDVLSFSLLCSSIRPVATRRLLSMRPVPLREYDSAQKFHTFLLADAVTRAPNIRALHIGGPENTPRWIANKESSISSLLVDIITSCPQLEHVSIYFEDRYRADDQPIVVAIAALQNLRSLTVSGWSKQALHLLHQVSSPLRRLAVHSTHISHPVALEEFLPRLAPTLEELELLYFRVHQGIPSPHSFLDRTQYPAVRSLSVCCFTGKPLLDRLHHLFPALDGSLSLGLFDTETNTDPYDDIRAANQLAQEGSPAHAWEKLDRLVCDAPMLYVLALRCPIRLVMLDKGSAETLCYAADALRENPVPRLKLTLRCGRGMLDGVFSPELASELSHLTLCLVYDNEHRSGTSAGAHADDFAQLSWDDLLATVLSALQPLHNLTHLRVVVHCKVYSPVSSRLLAPSEKFVGAVRGPAFDFDGTAAALARALPSGSLRYVFLTTSGDLGTRDEATMSSRSHERWNVSRAWRVAPPGTNGVQDDAESSTLVELHGEVAEAIVRNEELVLSETDEYSLYTREV